MAERDKTLTYVRDPYLESLEARMVALEEREIDIQLISHVNDVPWHEALRPWRWHKHVAQTRAYVDGEAVHRCACGAFGPAPWIMLWPDKPRVRPWWKVVARDRSSAVEGPEDG